MSVALLERAASALGELGDHVVYVGGATLVLWSTDPAAQAARPTRDVDVIVEVASRSELIAFDEALRTHGFREDIDEGVIGRWRHGDDLILDAIPSDASLLGFANRWQRAALPHAIHHTLPSGTIVRAVSPPYLVATKLEAFAGRGRGDFLGSRDLEDVLWLFDSRAALVEEVHAADAEVREYVATELTRHLAAPRFLDALYGFMPPDAASQTRADEVLLPRLRAVAAQR